MCQQFLAMLLQQNKALSLDYALAVIKDVEPHSKPIFPHFPLPGTPSGMAWCAWHPSGDEREKLLGGTGHVTSLPACVDCVACGARRAFD